MAATLKQYISDKLELLMHENIDDLLTKRYKKIRHIGVFESHEHNSSVFMNQDDTTNGNEDQ